MLLADQLAIGRQLSPDLPVAQPDVQTHIQYLHGNEPVIQCRPIALDLLRAQYAELKLAKHDHGNRAIPQG